MNKKFFKLAFLSAALVASVGSFVACNDYDSDIDELNDRIKALEADKSKIEALINQGFVITDVNKADGTITLNFSNGQTLYVTDGKDGKDGKDAALWTIENDGYWYKDGVKTEYKAVGEDGEPGAPGNPGNPGAPGNPGLSAYEIAVNNGFTGTEAEWLASLKGDPGQSAEPAEAVSGKIYIPGNDGFWYEYDPANEGDSVKTSARWDSLALTAVVENGTLIISKAGEEIWRFNDAVVLRAQSIVFHPEFYYGGIPATYASVISYKAVTPKYKNEELDANKDEQGDTINTAKTDSIIGDDEVTTVSPGLLLNFDFNPYGVRLPKKGDLKLRQFERNYVPVEALENLNVTEDPVRAEVDGYKYVQVKAQFTGRPAQGSKKVTVLQLEAYGNAGNTKDTVVVSDYFAVVPNEISDPVIAMSSLAAKDTFVNADTTAVVHALPGFFKYDEVGDTVTLRQNGECAHLYDTLREALADTAWLYVPYNESIDLRKYVTTHYTSGSKHVNDSVIEKLGFEYQFELVGWKDGKFNTQQSAQSKIDGSIFTPALTSGGNQAGETQSRATIGREPLVRVLLYDTYTKQYAAGGYLKIRITDAAPEAQVIVATARFGYATPAYTASFETHCPVDTVADTLKWYQIEEHILHALGSTATEFENNWHLDSLVADSSILKPNGEAIQFVAAPTFPTEWTQDEAKDVEVSGDVLTPIKTAKAIKGQHLTEKDNYIGAVYATTVDSAATKTNVLIWKLPYQEALNAFKAGKKSIQTVVRYVNNNNDKLYVYVVFTWTPENIWVKPQAEITGEFVESWYKHNESEHTALEDLHANVEQAFASKADGSGNATDCAFWFDILKTYSGNKVTLKVTDEDDPSHEFKRLQDSVRFVFDDIKNQYGYEAASLSIKLTGVDSTYYLRVIEDTILVAVNYDAVSGSKQADKEKTLTGKNFNTKTVFTDTVVKIVGSLVVVDSTSYAFKELVNVADHYKFAEGESFQTKLLAQVGDKCNGTIKGAKNFWVKYLRPLNVAPGTPDTLLDGRTGGADTVLFANLVISDWRDTFGGTKSYDSGKNDFNFSDTTALIDGKKGQDFLDYYGVDSIAVDTLNITFNRKVAGKNYQLGNTKTSLIKTEDPALYKSLHYVAPDGGLSAGNYGGLALSNTGTTHSSYTIQVPIVVFYKWGKLKSHIDIVISGTDGANGKPVRR